LTQFVHDPGRKVQARRGRGHGYRPLCENGLVAIAVGGFIHAPDVGRQWHMADLIDDL
jgi:hypothetical protein